MTSAIVPEIVDVEITDALGPDLVGEPVAAGGSRAR